MACLVAGGLAIWQLKKNIQGIPHANSQILGTMVADQAVWPPGAMPQSEPTQVSRDDAAIVKASVPDNAAETLWRGHVAWIVLVTLIAITGLCLMFAALMREFGRHEAGQAALRDSERRLAEKSDLLEATLEHMDQGLLMVTPGGIVAVCNQRAIELLELPVELIRSRPTFDAVVEYQREQQEFANLLPEGQPHLFRGLPKTLVHHERQRPNGTILEMTSVPLAGGGMVRTFKDITARRLAEDRVSHLAFHDGLTQLFNRAMILQRLQQAIAEAEKVSGGLAVLYLDLDRFKQVNDTLGHAAGDLLLVEVAARIRAELREGDAVGRLGGDEFAIVCPGVATAEQARRSALRLGAAIRRPYVLDGETCQIDVTIGMALFPADGSTAETLLRRADSALYRAKVGGGSAVACYEAGAEHAGADALQLEHDLRLAFDLDQFELAYQPIFDMETGTTIAFEALLRWRHPSRGLVQPADFIAAAERLDLTGRLGRWVLLTACAEAATWATPVRVAVDLSAAQFCRDGMESQVIETLQHSGLAAERLVLEVDYAVLLEDQRLVLPTMLSLRALGVGLVLDDFRPAEGSLSGLRGLPFEQVKIDWCRVASTLSEPSAMAALRTALDLAAVLRLGMAAAGVEEQAELDMLRRLGCGQVQGDLLGRPQSPERTRDYLWQATRRNDGRGLGAV